MAEIQRTMFAAQAVGLADYFKYVIANKHKLSSGHVPELSAPEGESTEGGKLALQHIKLVPAQGGATVVMGHVNSVDKRAEINTFARTQSVFQARFGGTGAPFSHDEYTKLVDAMHAFFSEKGLRVVMLADAPSPVAKATAEPVIAATPGNKVWVAVVAALAVFVVGVLLLR